MPSWISWDFRCDKCEYTFFETVDRSKQDDGLSCPECDGHASRFYGVPNVSTSKTSVSIPDVAASGRFDELKKRQSLKKLRSAAKSKGDMKEAKAIAKELKER